MNLRGLALVALCGCSAPVNAVPDDADAAAQLARGAAALRAMDCARCHGRDYAGWAAPSLLAAVREGSRERFDYFVLEGDAMRGMPGYRSQPRVVQDLDAIYAYLRACAEPPLRRCAPLNPSATRQQRSPP